MEEVQEPQEKPPGTVVGEIRIHAEVEVVRDGKIVPPDEETEE